jgi:hypothetical protein
MSVRLVLIIGGGRRVHYETFTGYDCGRLGTTPARQAWKTGWRLQRLKHCEGFEVLPT